MNEAERSMDTCTKGQSQNMRANSKKTKAENIGSIRKNYAARSERKEHLSVLRPKAEVLILARVPLHLQTRDS